MKTVLLTLLLSVAFVPVDALKLPAIFSDHMVLQRDRAVVIWGWAGKGESVRVSINGHKATAKAGADGRWKVSLAASAAGGPYELTVTGKSQTLVLKDILFGDVWLGSGQSNMEWTLNNTRNAKEEIAAANYPQIRLFTVQKEMSFQPRADVLPAAWAVCTPEAAANFSAVAYFFGRKLHQDLQVPIGLINSSWGGTNIETWTSWDVMSTIPPFDKTDLAVYEKESSGMQAKIDQYMQAMNMDRGLTERWYDPATSTTDWKLVQVPAEWGKTPIGDVDGIVWFRRDIELVAGTPAVLNLGPVDDIDDTYVNGVRVGSEDAWNKDRTYTVPASLIKNGKNVLVVKVRDDQGGGGMYGKPEQLTIEQNGRQQPLAGEWLYRTSVVTTDYGVRQTGPNAFPSLLFNAMIAPITSFAIKGAIWYQGESNAGEAFKYRTLFPSLINNWRKQWGYEFPFYWVQLANYMDVREQPVQSAWAELREAQSLTLKLPQTGQAVIIDIGEAADIHPRNKQDVGLRLALSALQRTYGKQVVGSGPVLKSWRQEGDKIILKFAEVGGGLVVHDKYGYVKGFSIAGADQRFVWARAEIHGDEVVVSAQGVSDPVAVRYAWADNPDDANLYNKEGLPASPFRTDSWKGVTEP